MTLLPDPSRWDRFDGSSSQLVPRFTRAPERRNNRTWTGRAILPAELARRCASSPQVSFSDQSGILPSLIGVRQMR